MEASPPRSLALALALLLLVLAAGAHAVKLPFKTCSRNDKNLDECVLTSAKAAIRSLLPGDPKLKVPPLNPLRVEEVRVDQSGSVGLNLVLREVDIFGLADNDLRSVKFDLGKQSLEIDMFIPNLQLISKYNISGKILILPIYGQGNSNITLENVPLNYSMKYDIENRKGKDYMRVVDKTVGFDTSKAYFSFENLFNGDERLRSNIRQVVSENWRQVIDDIGPTVAAAIGEVVTQVFRNVLTLIPYDELFPDTPK